MNKPDLTGIIEAFRADMRRDPEWCQAVDDPSLEPAWHAVATGDFAGLSAEDAIYAAMMRGAALVAHFS